MVTKMSDKMGNLRLHSLCLALQEFTFEVIHRKGALHLDADAVSRLFRKDEVAYVFQEEDLRDDMDPLIDKDKAMLTSKWGNKDSLQIQEIIARHQMEQRESNTTDIMKGSDLIDLGHYNLNDTLLSTNVEDRPLFETDDPATYHQQVNSITSIISSNSSTDSGIIRSVFIVMLVALLVIIT